MARSQPPLITSLTRSKRRRVQEETHDIPPSRQYHDNRTSTATLHEVPATLQSSSVQSSDDNISGRSKQSQGMSSRMQPFIEQLPKIQQYYLNTHAHPLTNLPCTLCPSELKQRPAATYRCLDCFLHPPSCKPCFIERHRLLPFHHLEEWNGSFFTRCTLRDVGLMFYLGHNGTRCPKCDLSNTGRSLTIYASNGVHEVFVLYCDCSATTSHSDQLFSSQLFPASLTDPKSCFTFELLNQYHIHASVSKKAAYDYFRALLRLTDNVLPDEISDGYRQFQLIMRIHRHLAQARRAGGAHGMDSLVPNRPKGLIRVVCPACPEPDFNVPLSTMLNCKEDERGKYTLFLDADGTFNMPRLAKKDDPDDISLNNGASVFVEDSRYQDYMKLQAPESNQSTCNDLKMVKLQNLKKFKNCTVAGVASIGCTRHGLFIRMSDLPGGERFCCTDYALAEALKELCWWSEAAKTKGLIKLGYDIWCQYKINLVRRFEKNKEWFPHLAQIVAEIDGIIGPVHIVGHVESCMVKFSANTTPNVGHLVTDMLEQRFSETKTTGGSTKQMNAGHRHDTLDDYHNFWNWLKVTNLGKSIATQYIKAKKLAEQLDQTFSELSQSHSPTLIKEWEALYSSPRPPHDAKDPPNLFKSSIKPPSYAVEDILQSEQAYLLPFGLRGRAKLMTNTLLYALDVELEMFNTQYLLCSPGDKDAETTLSTAREKLYDKVVEVVSRLRAAFPSLATHLDEINADGLIKPDSPEQYRLPLPSRFNDAIRTACDMDNGARIELELRKGRACESLEDVRTNVLSWCINSRVRYDELHSQDQNTRAQKFLSGLMQAARRAANVYNHHRSWLLHLGVPKDSEEFRALDVKKELWIKDPSKARKPGDTYKPDPWYWSTGMPDGVDRAQWQIEMHRVKWFKDRADVERWREEVGILEAEAVRVPKWHEKTASNWRQLAKESVGSLGYTAYAYKQEAVHRRLKERFEIEWTKGLGKLKPNTTTKTPCRTATPELPETPF